MRNVGQLLHTEAFANHQNIVVGALGHMVPRDGRSVKDHRPEPIRISRLKFLDKFIWGQFSTSTSITVSREWKCKRLILTDLLLRSRYYHQLRPAPPPPDKPPPNPPKPPLPPNPPPPYPPRPARPLERRKSANQGFLMKISSPINPIMM